MFRVPQSAHFLFTSDAERTRYESAARTSKTDIRILLGDKLKVIGRSEGAILDEKQLSLLLSVLLRGAREMKRPPEIREEWLLLLLKQHGQKGGAVAQYLRVETTPPRGWKKEAVSENDFFANARRLWGHFEANR